MTERGVECGHCGASTPLPADLRVVTFACAFCHGTLPTAAYVGDPMRRAEEMRAFFRRVAEHPSSPGPAPRARAPVGNPFADIARQVAGNQALRRLREEGVPCGRCGGKNAVPDDGSVQVVCRFCGQTILLADHVDEDAVARARLRHGAAAMREELAARQRRESRIVGVAVIALFAIGLGVLGYFVLFVQ